MSKNIQNKYRKLTDVEHALERPTIYIGSTEFTKSISQVFNFDTDKIEDKEIEIIPGIMTLFNELINNSYDEWVRSHQENKKNKVTNIDVEINLDENSFTVKDNGGIPVIMHSEYGEMLPSMLFGSLRSGSNYTDDRGTVSGVNGVGASLVNVFSTKFEVVTADGKKKFSQTWNGVKDGKLSVESTNIKASKLNFTEIKSFLDVKRFDIEGFTQDIVDRMIMRCIEIAVSGCHSKKPLKVKLEIIENNKSKVKYGWSFKQFSEFKDLYSDSKKFVGDDTPRYKFEIGPSTSGNFESVALVNSIRTDFGTHIDTLSWYIVDHLRKFIKKKHKLDVKPAQIKNQMRFYSWWLIDAPSFATQTKEQLITKPKDFGFDINVKNDLLKSLEKSPIIINIVNDVKAKEHVKELQKLKELDKTILTPKNKRLYVDKLVDATSTKNRHDCVLYIVEGDSAGNGFRKVRDGKIHGLFKLRGKFKNVFYQEAKDLIGGKRKRNDESELLRLMRSLGFQFNEKAATKNSKGVWELSKNLRYGKICIMTDADVDGYSIACQLVLLFKKFWPEALEADMIFRVLTPIVIVKDKKKKHRFYNLADYQEFEAKNDVTKMVVEYTKGLGRLEDDEYDTIIHSPKLQKITTTSEDWKYLYGWFGQNADLRKLLIADRIEEFEEAMEDEIISFTR